MGKKKKLPLIDNSIIKVSYKDSNFIESRLRLPD